MKSIVDGIEWSYSVSDGKATIQNDEMYASAISSDTKGIITIPSTLDGYPVTSIGASAFIRCHSLTSIMIPNSVTSIGERACSDCDHLTSIIIPDSVVSIGEYAFSSCYNLIEVNIPDHVISIGGHAFFFCDHLTSIIIPDRVTSIGDHAFAYCSRLTEIAISGNVTLIGDHAFGGCDSLEKITVEDHNPTYQSIDDVLFNKDLTTLIHYPSQKEGAYVIPDSVKTIEEYAFHNCDQLPKITIPKSVTSMGDKPFSGSAQLTRCPQLTHIIVDEGNPTYRSIDGVLFDKDLTTLIFYPSNKEGGYIIPNGVKLINEEAFCGSILTDIVIPSSVVSLGRYAFHECEDLISVIIPDGVTSIGEEAFSRCSRLTHITIPDSVVFVGEGAFEYCERLTAITLPNGVTSIDEDTFRNCNRLTEITIPSSVTHIDDHAFERCENLEKIIVEDDNLTYQSMDGVLFNKDHTTLIHYPSQKEGAYIVPHCVTSIEKCAFKDCKRLIKVTIPKSVIAIGESAFSGCFQLTDIIVEDHNPTYQSIDGILFDKDLTTLIHYPPQRNGPYVIPYGIQSISDGAFRGSFHLTHVTIPESVTVIEDSAFASCARLTHITIPHHVKSLGANVFTYCDNLTSIVIPDSVTSIGAYAFYYCEHLIHLTIPSSVTFIGESAFWRCDRLTYITVEDQNPTYQSIDGVLFDKDLTTLIFCPLKKSGRCTIPKSTTLISQRLLFYRCSHLTEIFVEDGNPAYTSIDGVLFDKNLTTLIYYPAKKEGTYTIPDGITSIRERAFHTCQTLTCITIPASITSIGESAFDRCDRLTHIIVEDHNATYRSVDGVLFSKHLTSLIRHPSGREGAYVIPDSVISIVKWAFYECVNMTDVTISKNVQSIDKGAFAFCDRLTHATIPESVTSIGEDIFWQCLKLSNVIFMGQVPTIDDTLVYLKDTTIIYPREYSEAWQTYLNRDGLTRHRPN